MKLIGCHSMMLNSGCQCDRIQSPRRQDGGQVPEGPSKLGYVKCKDLS